MKRIIPLALLLVLTLSYSFATKQTETSYFVQFKINTVSSNDQAMVIDQKMRLKSGIKLTRTDYMSSTFFCVLEPQIQYSEQDFKNWFEQLGYKISCYNTGIQGKEQIIAPIILKNCHDEN